MGCDNVYFFIHTYSKGAVINSLSPPDWWRNEYKECKDEVRELKHDRQVNLDAIKILEYNQAYLAKYQAFLKKEIAWMKREVAK